MPPPKRAPKQARKPAEHSHQNGDLHLQAMAQIAVLFDLVDMTRLIAIRDRLFPVPSALSHISAQLAYKEYLRFLAIKILSSDIPALNLSPSWYIDQLWHAHILDTEAYALLRNKWPDRMIHDPLPHPGQEARLKVTRDKCSDK
ncbi:hypothetical protein BDZ91DRAFT_174935 [Kalaharituber pfeilii]|nr:hypothetical protein BDZ91DRAFT_174935 [Kalaharituber pfeilii]